MAGWGDDCAPLEQIKHLSDGFIDAQAVGGDEDFRIFWILVG